MIKLDGSEFVLTIEHYVIAVYVHLGTGEEEIKAEG
jgi:hypothetical protein